MLTQHSLPPLSHVEIRTSGIIPAPIADVSPACLMILLMVPHSEAAVSMATYKALKDLVVRLTILHTVVQVWKTVRSFGTVADWSAPVGMERITSMLLVHPHLYAKPCCSSLRYDASRGACYVPARPPELLVLCNAYSVQL